MKHTVFLIFFFVTVALSAAAQANSDKQIKSDYLSGKTSPVSFTIGDASSTSFLGELKATVNDKTTDRIAHRTIVYKNSSGVELRIEAQFYPDFNAVEWVGWLKNNGSTNSPIIKDIDVCNVLTELKASANDTVYWSRGSDGEINDFEPMTTAIRKEVVKFGTNLGRSSDTDCLPFFNLHDGQNGVVAGIGWSGNWQSTMQQKNGKVALSAGFSRTMGFYLKPGEEVRTPSIVLMFWQGKDRMMGHNQFRQLILRHFTRQIDGKPANSPISMSLGYNGPKPCVEFYCTDADYAQSIIARANRYGINPEIWWIDAGWYKCPVDDWTHVGTWEPDSTRFPFGFAPIGLQAKKYHQGFLVWFEPERVTKDSWIYENKPEYLLRAKGKASCLLDLGNPEVVKWISNHINKIIKDGGLTFYRQDFNMRPVDYWNQNDEPNRKGIHEIRHIMGLYQYWDNLLNANPGLQIDNCASGGRRLDMETTKRSIPLWRTDYNYHEPVGYQSQTYGLEYFLPCHTTGCGSTETYNFRSGMTNGYNLAWNINADHFDAPAGHALLAELRDVRDYFYKDFYPVTPYSTSSRNWIGYQFNDAISNTGVVLVFRRDNAGKQQHISIHGLIESANYELFFKDFGITKTYSGKELTEKGLDIAIPQQPGSLLIKYKKTN